ncbi:MAG: nucleotidyltransferase domain-containing protein [Nanoarchaeota archaeon]|nr:nucleotidyltransferase domain-containing protein [Nanoarchaeota archaeon]
MLHTNKLKILELFFEEPNRNFHLRQISRLTKIAVTSVRKYLDELLHESLITKDTKTIYPTYVANETNKIFRVYKQQRIILKIHVSGLIDYLEETTLPKCIILFGSMSKGEYTKTSDIDILIQAPNQELNLEKFEKKLNHKINILFEPKLNNLNQGLLNNILNGYVLSGQIKL